MAELGFADVSTPFFL